MAPAKPCLAQHAASLHAPRTRAHGARHHASTAPRVAAALTEPTYARRRPAGASGAGGLHNTGACTWARARHGRRAVSLDPGIAAGAPRLGSRYTSKRIAPLMNLHLAAPGTPHPPAPLNLPHASAPHKAPPAVVPRSACALCCASVCCTCTCARTPAAVQRAHAATFSCFTKCNVYAAVAPPCCICAAPAPLVAALQDHTLTANTPHPRRASRGWLGAGHNISASFSSCTCSHPTCGCISACPAVFRLPNGPRRSVPGRCSPVAGSAQCHRRQPPCQTSGGIPTTWRSSRVRPRKRAPPVVPRRATCAALAHTSIRHLMPARTAVWQTEPPFRPCTARRRQ